MKKTIFAFLFVLLTTSLILAGNENQNQQGVSEQDLEARRIRIQEGERILREMIQNGTSLNILGKVVNVTSEEGKDLEMEVEGVRARSRVNLFLENDGAENENSLRVALSNGNNAWIKVMPDTASQRAIERLQLKVCNPEEGCLIELKEVGEKNQTRATYEIKAKKEGKFLGLFKTKIDVEAQVDAETGEIIKTKKAWWAFLASE